MHQRNTGRARADRPGSLRLQTHISKSDIQIRLSALPKLQRFTAQKKLLEKSVYFVWLWVDTNRQGTMILPSDEQHLTRNTKMTTEAKATKAAEIMSRETGKACKVIYLGNNKYTAVIVGSTRHMQSVGH